MVYLFSDLQRAGIRRRPDSPFPDTAAVTIVDVGRLLSRNLAVEDVQVEQADLRPGLPTTWAARIANTGAFAARDVPLFLHWTGDRGHIRPSDSNRTRARSCDFRSLSPERGLYHGSVAIAGEDEIFAADDRRWLAFECGVPSGSY